MTRTALWFSVFSTVSLFALSGCAAEAGGKGKVSCGKLCEAQGACIPMGTGGGAGQESWSLEGCLSACAGWNSDCRDATQGACFACWESCDEGCVATACVCDEGERQPGERCQRDDDCVNGSICFDGTCVGAGPLRVTLSFGVDSDFDLHLRTPAGNEIYFGARDADGGLLDVDQCGPATECGEGNHVENIVFRSTANPGEYTVWVVNYNGRSSGAFRIEVETLDGRETFAGTLPAEALLESQHFRFTVR